MFFHVGHQKLHFFDFWALPSRLEAARVTFRVPKEERLKAAHLGAELSSRLHETHVFESWQKSIENSNFRHE